MGIKAWITVNGNHIPIMDGESKIDAIGRFIKGKRHGADMRMKEMERELSGDLPHTTKDIYNEYNKQAAIYQRYGGGKTIKGYDTPAKRQKRADAEFQPAHEANMKEFFEKAKGKSRYEQEKLWAEAMEKGGKLVEKHIRTTHPKYKLSDKYKVETDRQRRQAERENIRNKLANAKTVIVDGKKFERIKNTHGFNEYESGGIHWGEDTLINRIQNSDSFHIRDYARSQEATRTRDRMRKQVKSKRR